MRTSRRPSGLQPSGSPLSEPARALDEGWWRQACGAKSGRMSPRRAEAWRQVLLFQVHTPNTASREAGTEICPRKSLKFTTFLGLGFHSRLDADTDKGRH